MLIHGASGSVGLAAVHVAKLRRRDRDRDRPLADEARRRTRARRRSRALCAGTLRDDVKAITNGRGVDVVYDGVGGDISVESLRCVRFGARYLIVGWAATPQARGKPNQLPTNLIMMKGLDVLGCPTVISTINDPSIRAARLAQVLEWADASKLVPYVSHRFALADFKAALMAKWRGEVHRRLVVQP